MCNAECNSCLGKLALPSAKPSLVRGVPPQPNCPPAAVPVSRKKLASELQTSRGKRYVDSRVVLHVRTNVLSNKRLPPSPDPKTWVRRSHLRYAAANISQQQAAVKLYGVFSSRWRSPEYAPDINFARCWLGTVGISLSPSCRPTINRQGITLP